MAEPKPSTLPNIIGSAEKQQLSKYYDSLQLLEVYFYYFVVIELIMILPAIIGNGLILASIARFKQLRTRLHVLVANLAVADFLVGTLVIPVDLHLIIRSSTLSSKNWCLLSQALTHTFLSASILNLFLISMERYMAIVKPMIYINRCTKKRLCICIFSSWILVIIVSFMPMWGVNTWEDGMPCDSDYVFPRWYNALLYILAISFLIGNFIMYAIVVKTAWNQIERIEAEDNVTKETKKQHFQNVKKMRKTKIMILVLGVFAICWAPYVLAAIMHIFIFPKNRIIMIVKHFLACLGMLNSGLNWIIYGLKNSKFRKAFKLLITCKHTIPLTYESNCTKVHVRQC